MKDFFDWVNHHSTPEWMSLVVISTNGTVRSSDLKSVISKL